MALTQAQINQAVKLELYSAQVTERPYEALINETFSDVDTTLTLDDGTPWAVGDIGEFDDGEQVLVTAVATNDLTVIRGYNGTTAAAQADDSRIVKNPRFSIAQIEQATGHALDILADYLYVETTETITYDPTTRWYALSTTFDKVLTVFYKPTNEDYPAPVEYWHWERGVPSAAFTQDEGLWLPQTMDIASGADIYVVGRVRPSAITELDDSFKHCVTMGVCYYLLGAANVARTHDPGKRTDRTVQPGQEARDSIWYYREFQGAIDRLRERLTRLEKNLPTSRQASRARRFRP